MKKHFYIIILLLTCTFVYAQTSEEKAKSYYEEAVRAFNNKNYTQTLDFCIKVAEELKSTNARIELLRVKSYYELEDLGNSRAALLTFSDLSAEPILKNEALSYLVKIEEKEKIIRQKKLEQELKSKEQRLEQDRKIAEEKLKSEQIKAESYNAAMSGNVVAIRQFLQDYPNHIDKNQFLNLLDIKENEEYIEALKNDEISYYENYLRLFKNGKHNLEINNLLALAKEKLAYEQVLEKNTIEAAENYLSSYPNGFSKNEVLTVLKQNLLKNSDIAMANKEYLIAETLLGKYIASFPQGTELKTVQAKYKIAQAKIKHQKIIDNRKDKIYLMLNYATNESAGFEFGKLNLTYIPAIYWALNFGFRYPVEEFDVVELKSPEDYTGTGTLKPGLISSSFGFNMKITYPLWFYIGAGVRYQVYVDGSSTSYKITGENYWQVFPEFGLRTRLGKNISLKTGVKLFKDKPAFQFGIGF